jgi:hypothetical protein
VKVSPDFLALQQLKEDILFFYTKFAVVGKSHIALQ